MKNWCLDRISYIDKAILFFALAKIKYLNYPLNTTVSEAIELAKIFSEKKSSKFVNGVLDAWYNKYFREA